MKAVENLFLFFLMCICTITCRSAKQIDDAKSFYDFIIINEKFQNNWIDKEINVSLITNDNQVLDMYLDGLEDNYVSCFHAGIIYITDNTMKKTSFENLNFKDVTFYSETDLPILKKNQYKLSIDENDFRVFKVKLIGCKSSWESIGIKSRNLHSPVLLPIKIESYKMTNYDKEFIKQSIKKLLSSN